MSWDVRHSALGERTVAWGRVARYRVRGLDASRCDVQPERGDARAAQFSAAWGRRPYDRLERHDDEFFSRDPSLQ